MNEENMENFKERKKNNVWIFVVILLLILLLGGAGFFLFKSKTVSSKQVFITAIHSIYESEKKDIAKLETGQVGGIMNLSTNLKSDDSDTQSLLDVINKLHISMDVKMDAKSKAMEMDLASTYNQKDLLNAKMSILKDVAYFDLNSIFDKTIKYPIEDEEGVFEEFYGLLNKTEELNCILENLNNGFTSALKDEYFTKSQETINVNGKDVKATKHTLTLNDENIQKIEQDFKNNVDRDAVMKALASLLNTTVEELEEDAETDFDNEEGITTYIHIYTYGLKNEFAKFEIEEENDSIVVTKTDENTYDYTANFDDQKISGTVTIDGEKYTFTIVLDTEDISGSIEVVYQEMNSVTIDSIDTANTISIDQLSDVDAMQILENLQKQDGVTELLQAIQKLNILSF